MLKMWKDLQKNTISIGTRCGHTLSLRSVQAKKELKKLEKIVPEEGIVPTYESGK